MLIPYCIALALNNPQGGCVGEDPIVLEKGAEKLDRPGMSSRSALLPRTLWEGEIAEQFHPEGYKAPRPHHLGIELGVLQHKEIKSASALASRDPHASQHVLSHFLIVALSDVVAFVTVEAAPVDDRGGQAGAAHPCCPDARNSFGRGQKLGEFRSQHWVPSY